MRLARLGPDRPEAPLFPETHRPSAARCKIPRRVTRPKRLSTYRRLRRAHPGRLEKTHPEARCALDYRNAFELSVATILSAQCTDERVNQVTTAALRALSRRRVARGRRPAELEEIIRSTGFFRAKAKSLIGFAKGLVERHAGQVPRTMAELVPLPGIGRKTANVVLGHAFGVNEGIAVDTHVLRVTNRLGLAQRRRSAEDRGPADGSRSARALDADDGPADLPRTQGLRCAAARVRHVPALSRLPLGEPPGVGRGTAASGPRQGSPQEPHARRTARPDSQAWALKANGFLPRP